MTLGKLVLNNRIVHYQVFGKGEPLVLLHGYLESLEIWGKFASQLSEKFRVISIDLPGFGLSDAFSKTHTMEFFSEATIAVINKLEIDRFVLVGHSLGGYVTLAFLDRYPHKIKGLCLFHSHPFPDSAITIEKRKREISLVNKGKQELIFNINIPNAFANINIDKLSYEIEKAKTIAAKTQPEGIIAALNGMMQRQSREKILAETNVPVLLILGKHDNYIPYREVGMKIRLPENGKIITLENSGHMGFIEETGLAVSVLSNFVKSLNNNQAGST